MPDQSSSWLAPEQHVERLQARNREFDNEPIAEYDTLQNKAPLVCMTTTLSHLFFTAPWEPVSVRRGDALGLGALADKFSDAVAPDLSNRISDGRWVTLLAWSLVQSQLAFQASGGRSVVTRKEQIQRYAWLRPLELMWVARTISLLKADTEDWKQRPLQGRRRVAPWVAGNMKADRFGMTPKQFQAYRQTGPYGGYRRAFRKWPGLTTGDGWTPARQSMTLSSWLDGKLKGARLQLADDVSRSAKLAGNKEGRDGENKWWLEHWQTFDQAAQNGKAAELNTLPRQRGDFSVLAEAALLKPIIFGNDPAGKKRLTIVQSIANSGATDHGSLCQYLSQHFSSDPTIARLATFSRLADAGLDAMNYINEALNREPKVALADVARGGAAKEVCKALQAAAQAWLSVQAGSTAQATTLRHADAADRFAQTMAASAVPLDCFRQLLRHHETYGGGLRWFVLRDGQVEARTRSNGEASRYGFRLWALCRLAVQCGVLTKMPIALHDDIELDNDDDDDAQ